MTLLDQLSPEQILDTLAISVNGPQAWNLDLALDLSLEDLAANYRVTLRNAVLVYRKVSADPSTAQATVSFATKSRLIALAFGDLASPGYKVSGDTSILQSLLGVLDKPQPAFDIVTP